MPATDPLNLILGVLWDVLEAHFAALPGYVGTGNQERGAKGVAKRRLFNVSYGDARKGRIRIVPAGGGGMAPATSTAVAFQQAYAIQVGTQREDPEDFLAVKWEVQRAFAKLDNPSNLNRPDLVSRARFIDTADTNQDAEMIQGGQENSWSGVMTVAVEFLKAKESLR